VSTELTLDRRHQIPDTALGDQSQRFDEALDAVVTFATVSEMELALVPDSFLNRGEFRNVFTGGMPSRGIDVDALASILRVAARDRGQRGEQFQPGDLRGLPQPEVRQKPGRLGEEERLDLRRVEARQPGLIAL